MIPVFDTGVTPTCFRDGAVFEPVFNTLVFFGGGIVFVLVCYTSLVLQFHPSFYLVFVLVFSPEFS